MEIERKYLVKEIPDLTQYAYHQIEQGYISTKPVIRIRRRDNDYILTYKGSGLLAREELEAYISAEDYKNLSSKIEGSSIIKKRYLIPFNTHTIELDVFEGHMQGLVLAEVEFKSLDDANSFTPPEFFGNEVTNDSRYHNSSMVFAPPYLTWETR